MEGCFSGLLAFAALVLGIVALVRARRIEILERRIENLDMALSEHRRRLDHFVAEGARLEGRAPKPAAATPAPEVRQPPVAPPEPPRPEEIEKKPPPPQPVPDVPPPVQTAPTAITAPPPPKVVTRPVPPPPAPLEDPAEGPPAPRRNLEEVLGTQVFLKAGVTIVVLGVVFFLGYALKIMGPLGRVVVGYLIGGGMLAGGLLAERRDLYRNFGRGLVAGAWGILYFVTFAMHFLPAARLIESRPVAAFTLLLAAGGAVAFSLRYRHEWTTAASFLLIFLSLLTAAVQLDATFNLIATSVVAAGLAVLAWRLSWDRLLAVGVPSTWLVLAVWMLPGLFDVSGPEAAGFSSVVVFVLALTWAVFQWPFLFPRAPESSREVWRGVAGVGNLTGFALALFYVHRTAPGNAWLVALLFSAAYLASAYHLARRSRRQLYLLLATIGSVLLALVPPLYFGAASRWMPLFWLIQMEMVLVAGALLRERYFRILAYVGFVFVVLDLLVRIGVIAPETRLPFLAGTVVLSGVNVYLVRTRWRATLGGKEAPAAALLFSCAASFLLLILLWQELPGPWVAPALAAASFGWITISLRFDWTDLFFEGLALTFFGALAVVIENRALGDVYLGLPGRPLTVLVTVTFLFLTQDLLRRRARREPAPDARIFPWVRKRDLAFVAGLYLSLPTLIVAWLVKAEALEYQKNLLVALVWGFLGTIYLEVARLLTSRRWNHHGHALIGAGTFHLFLVNFVQAGALGPLSLRLSTVVPFLLLLVWVYSSALDRAGGHGKLRLAYLYGMVAVAATLLLYELHRSWVVAAWAGLAVALLAFWQRGGSIHWRYAGTVLAIAAAVRGIAFNLSMRDEVLEFRTNLAALPLAALLLLGGYLAIRLRELRAPGEAEPEAARRLSESGRLAWLLSLIGLVTAFLVVEASGTALTVWLSLEGLAVVTLGFLTRERLARLTGLALLSFCILKLFIYDLRGLGGLARIFSFIVLGGILIVVSWAYTRFKDRMKELL